MALIKILLEAHAQGFSPQVNFVIEQTILYFISSLKTFYSLLHKEKTKPI